MKLFVSYRSTDSSKVDPIVHRLRSIGYDVWQDKDSIPVGQDWWEAICRGIEACEVLIFMVSTESVKSFACLAELSYAHELNVPIIPFVIEGEWVYNDGGKHDIEYWYDIPDELKDSRTQFLFYEGVNFVDKLKSGIDVLQDKNIPRFPASPPPDPRNATDESNNVTVIYDEAYDFAYRGELDHAKKLFRKLVKHNDATFSALSLEWIHIIDEYKRLKIMASLKSTRGIAQEQWQDYLKKFPKSYMEVTFDPANIEGILGNRSHQVSDKKIPVANKAIQNPQTPPTRARSTSLKLLPPPFDWVEIVNKGGSLKTSEGKTLAIPSDRFWIAKYPITNAQYRLFIEQDGYKDKSWWTKYGWYFKEIFDWTEPSLWLKKKWTEDTQPVVGVSWYEAMAFCRWLRSQTGEKINLPTREQWQYAAQGGDGRKYPWGNDWDNTRLQASKGSYAEVGRTSIVTKYDKIGESPFGVVDMLGNASEWCLALNDKDDPFSSTFDTLSQQFLCGGSWFQFTNLVFDCNRPSHDWAMERNFSFGFRIARY